MRLSPKRIHFLFQISQKAIKQRHPQLSPQPEATVHFSFIHTCPLVRFWSAFNANNGRNGRIHTNSVSFRFYYCSHLTVYLLSSIRGIFTPTSRNQPRLPPGVHVSFWLAAGAGDVCGFRDVAKCIVTHYEQGC